jgi:hypothetical protein
MSALLAAVDLLNERLVLASAIVGALEAAAPQDNPPPWIYVFRQQIEAIELAADEVESAVRWGAA